MTASSWDWKRTTKSKTPDEIGDELEHKDHHLHAIEGIFGERLVWECKNCGVTRRNSRDIGEKCPAAT